jgi:hypothetical protein
VVEVVALKVLLVVVLVVIVILTTVKHRVQTQHLKLVYN